MVTDFRTKWPLTAQEVAHAMPVLQAAHQGLRSVPAPRVATIRKLAERWDVRDGTLRTALSRACASGSLEVKDGRYRLGPLAREEAAAARALLARRRGYVLAVVLEGEEIDLARLREVFARQGFRPLQRSLWIGARTKDDRLNPALERAKLGGTVIVFQSDEVDEDARARLSKLWGLNERAVELRAFHRQLMNFVTQDRISAEERAWRCVEAAPVWYRIAVHDEPPFPLDLCGSDYPLDRLNEDWRTHLKSLTQALADLWTADER